MFVVSAYRYLLNTGRHFLIYKLMHTNNYVVNIPIQYIKNIIIYIHMLINKTSYKQMK